MKNKQSEKQYFRKKKRIEGIYKFLHVLLCNTLVRKFNLVTEKGKLPEGANLILSNHVTSADQFLVAWYYGRNHIHFVAGENAFKVPLFRWLIVNCMGAIIHMRGVSSLNTIKEMTGHLKKGGNVCIFPEGATTFDGRTEKIDASIAKVAKISGANLVLMRIEGGYFAKPRWGTSVRKGPVRISDTVITADELKKMSAKEVTDAINEQLYVDAYAGLTESEGLPSGQKNARIKYEGDAICKGLECCIYECPSCGKITGLKTTDTALKCECGFDAEYDEYGYLVEKKSGKESDGNSKEKSEDNTEEVRRYTITELCDNQKQHLKEALVKAREGIKEHAEDIKESPENIFLFGDEFDCKRLYSDGRRESRGRVKVDVYTDHIEFATGSTSIQIALSEVESFFIFLRNTINCKVSGREYVYELQGDFSSNALKYRDLYDIYKARD